MQKEIYEQPVAVADTIESIIDDGIISPKLIGGKKFDASRFDSVLILAAGTSYYAGLTAKYWFENIAGIPVNVEIASEYRYREVVTPKKQLVITISQSGSRLMRPTSTNWSTLLRHLSQLLGVLTSRTSRRPTVFTLSANFVSA